MCATPIGVSIASWGTQKCKPSCKELQELTQIFNYNGKSNKRTTLEHDRRRVESYCRTDKYRI